MVLTDMMQWVIDNKTEPPESIFGTNLDHRSMRHDPLLMDGAKFTLAMYWVIWVQTDPPQWMHHDPLLIGAFGRTLALTWVMYAKTEPPEWMRHDLKIKDNQGCTLASLWDIYAGDNPPEWMLR
jgi:hypothetical protein